MQTVDPTFAKTVLSWWVERAQAALLKGRSYREFTFCARGPETDALLLREDQTRHVVGIVLRMDKVGALVVPLEGRRNFVELQSGIDLVTRALGHLATKEETASFITGTTAPTMAADALHPLVWDAASNLWGDGHHGQAVQRAATFLNAHVQDLVDRHDVSDNSLMTQVFSPNPPEEGRPRLRWPGEDTNLTVKAMRQGILQFAQGCFMAIRNPATHGTDEANRQEALEQLAVLSTLARWIDKCDLVTVD